MRTFYYLVFSIFLISCSGKEDIVTIEKFSVTSPIIIDTALPTMYVGEVSAVQNVEIRSRINGYISANHVDEGKPVAKGQLLFSIDNSIQREELAKASAVLKSCQLEAKTAEIDYKNTRQLVEKNVVSVTELELAKIRFETAQAKVEEAQAYESHSKAILGFTEIRAPFSGIVNRIPFKLGSLVEEGTMLTSISNIEEVFVYFNITEAEYLDMIRGEGSKNSTIDFVLANGDAYNYKGNIETMAGEISPGTGTISFRARFPNPEFLLRHGATGKVLLYRPYKNAMIIPQKSVFEIQDLQYVFIVDRSNKISSRAINVRKRIPDFYIIDKGLKKDDRIVYEGVQLIRDGMTIEPAFINMKEIIKELNN
ncbi:MAG: efflux RND transporter periplasmic adaptor subunit [Flavobacteriales bacterium]